MMKARALMTILVAMAVSLVIPFPECEGSDPGCGLGCEIDNDFYIGESCYAMPDTSCCYTRTYYIQCKPTRPPQQGDPPIQCASYYQYVTAPNPYATCCEGFSDPTLKCRSLEECSSGG